MESPKSLKVSHWLSEFWGWICFCLQYLKLQLFHYQSSFDKAQQKSHLPFFHESSFNKKTTLFFVNDSTVASEPQLLIHEITESHGVVDGIRNSGMLNPPFMAIVNQPPLTPRTPPEIAGPYDQGLLRIGFPQ